MRPDAPTLPEPAPTSDRARRDEAWKIASADPTLESTSAQVPRRARSGLEYDSPFGEACQHRRPPSLAHFLGYGHTRAGPSWRTRPDSKDWRGAPMTPDDFPKNAK